MQHTKPSQRLDAKVRLFDRGYLDAMNRLWSHPEIKSIFPEILFRMYCETRASVDLLECTVDHLRREHTSDPLTPGLIPYFERLIAEEEGHDVWVLESLAACGISRDEVLARIPPPTSAALVGSQYYWAYHAHPVALLGYIKVVERNPATVEQIEQTIERTHLPRGAFRYHFGHVKLELEHNDALDEVLDTLPLTASHESLIGANAARTLYLLATMVEEVTSLHEGKTGLSKPRDEHVNA